jgi:hypothetical protein
MSNSNGTSSNAQCDANLHWTACLSKDGCPFHYSSTYMETNSAFAPHNDNYDQFYNGLGTDNNGPDDWPDDDFEVSYTGPWYGPDEECPNPEEDPFENYQWLCDNRYLIPTEPGEILEVSPKQFDLASGEKRPKFPAELYAPDGPWWNPSTTGQQTGQLPASQPAIPGPIPTDKPGSLPTEEAEDGPANLHNPQPKRIHQLVLEDVIHDELIADAIVKPRPATIGPSGLSTGQVYNVDNGITTVCTATRAKDSTLPGGYDPMDTDTLGMEGPAEIPDTGTNKIDKGKVIEKQQYDPRGRLPPFLINTELGDILLPAIIRGYQNDPMAQTGVRKPFKWHREQYISKNGLAACYHYYR